MSNTLRELKQEAQSASMTYDIVFEKFDRDPAARTEFLRTMQMNATLISAMESIYTRLTSGESSLGYEEIEKNLVLVEHALYEAYVLQDIYDRYQAVEDVLKIAT